MQKILFPVIFAITQLLASCQPQAGYTEKQPIPPIVGQGQSKLVYDIEKSSPSGTYRARVQIRTAPKKGTRDYTEVGQYQFYRGDELIYTNNWEESDDYESTFLELNPNVEWISESILRIGDDVSDQPFSDEILVENRTHEILKYISVGYGKNELFWIFDLSPGTKILLRAAPRFKPDGTSNYFIGYGGVAHTGKKFEGTVEAKARKSPAEGPLRFQITVNQKDLR